MTFTEILTAMVIICLFMPGIGSILLPLYNALEISMNELKTANALVFISQSFRDECNKQDQSMENWKNTVKAVRELEFCEITEMNQGFVRVLKAACIVSGEYVEILGLCTP